MDNRTTPGKTGVVLIYVGNIQKAHYSEIEGRFGNLLLVVPICHVFVCDPHSFWLLCRLVGFFSATERRREVSS
jgi:hypothetical protein